SDSVSTNFIAPWHLKWKTDSYDLMNGGIRAGKNDSHDLLRHLVVSSLALTSDGVKVDGTHLIVEVVYKYNHAGGNGVGGKNLVLVTIYLVDKYYRFSG
ncbi:unnamed protein product, partial [Allacma fusca]